MRKLEYKKVKRIDNSKCETEQILMIKVSDAPFRWAVFDKAKYDISMGKQKAYF